MRMQITTSRFGKIEIQEDQIITLPEGLVGFSNFKRYLVIEREKDRPFQWLQSVDNPELAFLITDPLLFCPHYKVELNPQENAILKLEKVKEGKVFVLVVIPPDPSQIRANLLAPLIINTSRRLGKQVILEKSGYPLQYQLVK